MLKIADRYLLKEMTIPFVLAILGFLIFFLLFLIGRFSQLLVDRIIPPSTLMLMLFYQLPNLLVLAFPVATLFAIFLALGRLGHDREIIALQASGISLRRLLVPLLLVGLFLSGIDFWIGDDLAPWGNRQYLRLYVEQIYGSRSTPHIQDNAFFKDDENRFFYVRHYNEKENVLEGVLIYDKSGQVNLPDGGTFPKVIAAESAVWDGQIWQLRRGIIHTFDDQGNLTYKSRFETMDLNVGETIRTLIFEQRSPSEMSLRELAERIETFRRIGRPAESLIVDYHAKIAIPLASFIFALFGAPLSLLIGPRGRALGVILSVLLVLLYQGVFFWTAEIMGKRGDLPPALGVHLPNLLFGLMGLVLLWQANCLGRLDLVERVKRLLPLALAALAPLGAALTGVAQPASEPVPIELSADILTLSEGWKTITAEGHVQAYYREGTIEAQQLTLFRGEADRWRIEARSARFSHREISGSAILLEAILIIQQDETITLEEITLEQSASIKFAGGRLSAESLSLKNREERAWDVEARSYVTLEQTAQKQTTQASFLRLRLRQDSPGGWQAQDALVEDFQGETDFINSRGERHRLRYRGREAHLSFNEKNQVSLLDVKDGDFTTCPCEAPIPEAAYSIRAQRLFIRPDEVLVAFNLTLRAFGSPLFWAPAYLAPLTDVQQKYPFIPELGRDGQRGWFAKWRIPLFLDEQNFGYLLLDYYTRYGEVGSGLDLFYRALPGSRGGRFSFYRLVGREESLALDWSEALKLNEKTQLDLSAGLRTGLLAREATRLLSQLLLSGEEGEWSWQVGLSREQNLLGPEPDPEVLKRLSYRVLERLPELSLAQKPLAIGGLPLRYSTGFDWGRYHEEALDGSSRESSRFDGRIQMNLEPLTPFMGIQLRAGSGYRLSLYEFTRRESWDVTAQAGWSPQSGLSLALEYLYRAVRGRSPFRFDELTTAHRATLRSSWNLSQLGSLQLSTGYDFARGSFDPLSLNAAYRLGMAQTSLGLTFDLNRPSLLKANMQGSTSSGGWQLALSGGYDFTQARFDDLIAKLDLGGPLRAGLRFDPNQLALRRVNLQSNWSLGDWELDFGGEYDLGLGRFRALTVGIIKKFCQACWQIGLFVNQNQLFLQARINAFPTAEVSYSPTDQTLSFGR